MKYQVTCDNCGSKFIVEAEEGSTVECQCPGCKGVMEITLPLVSEGQEFRQQPSYPIQGGGDNKGGGKNRLWMWIAFIVLLLIVISVGAYWGLSSGKPDGTPIDSTAVTDTIPYSTQVPQEEEPVVVDTVETSPQQQEPMEEEEPQQEEPAPADSAATDYETDSPEL